MKKQYPFKFLDSYQKEDADFFFGRKEEIDSLYEMIFQTRILVVFGTSGTGKTSLIQCGLANKFQSYDWLALNIRRGSDLNASLDEALCNHSDGKYTFEKKDEHQIDDLKDKVRSVYKASFRPLYLIFDQFEELYVLGSKEEQKKYIKAIHDILDSDQPVKIIISVREEYLGFMYEFEKKVPQLFRKKLRVEPMTLDKVLSVMKGFNSFENSLVKIDEKDIDKITEGIFDRLRDNERTLTIQLPYLQVFLDKLYYNITEDDSHESEAMITLEALNKLKSFGDVLQDFLERQVTVISRNLSTKKNKVETDSIWSILSQFCTLEGTKEPISRKGVKQSLGPGFKDEFVDKVIDLLQKSRIIRDSEVRDSEEKILYELYHDSLALKIAEKRSEDDISRLEVIRLVKSKASLSDDLQELFTAKQLHFIEPYEKRIESDLSKKEKRLIKKSKRAIRNAKLFKRASISAAVILIIIGVSFFGVRGEMRLEKDKILMGTDYLRSQILGAETLVKESSSILEINPTLALQLDLAAILKMDSLLSDSQKSDSLDWYSLPGLDTIKSHSPFYKFFTGFWGMPDTVGNLAPRIDTLYNKKKRQIENHADSIARLDHALYKVLIDSIAIQDSSFVNLIFPDKIKDGEFKIWRGSQVVLDSLEKNKESKNLAQIVFPRDSAGELSDAMVLFKNGVARYWGDHPAYKELQKNKDDKITSIAPIQYSKIGYKMLAAMNNKRIVEWNLNGTQRFNFHNEQKTKKVTYTIKSRDVKLNETIISIAIAPDRQKMFTASDKGIGTIWEANISTIDLSTDPKNAFNLYQETVLCSAFSSDGRMIATGSKDHKVKIWNADSGELIKEFKGHTGGVNSVAFSANNRFLFTTSFDGSVRRWNLSSIDPVTLRSKGAWNRNMSFDELFIEQAVDSFPHEEFGSDKIVVSN